MSIQIVAPNERISGIIADLSRRRAIIKDVAPKGDRNKVRWSQLEINNISTNVLSVDICERAFGRAIRLFQCTAYDQLRHGQHDNAAMRLLRNERPR